MIKKYDLDEYIEKYREYPPLITELPYNSDGYKIMIEYSLRKNEKLTEEKVSELIKKFNIEYGIVNETKPKQDKKESKNDMADSKKIRNLLKKYGASDYEIENFMDELEQEDFSPYSKEVIDKLKTTPEGRAIIRDMPKMKKEELISKIKGVLSNESKENN